MRVPCPLFWMVRRWLFATVDDDSLGVTEVLLHDAKGVIPEVGIRKAGPRLQQRGARGLWRTQPYNNPTFGLQYSNSDIVLMLLRGLVSFNSRSYIHPLGNCLGGVAGK